MYNCYGYFDPVFPPPLQYARILVACGGDLSLVPAGLIDVEYEEYYAKIHAFMNNIDSHRTFKTPLDENLATEVAQCAYVGIFLGLDRMVAEIRCLRMLDEYKKNIFR